MVIAITIIYWVPEIDLCPSAMDLDTLPHKKTHHIGMPTCSPKIDSSASSAATSGHGIELLKHGRVLGKRNFSPDEKMVPARRWLWLFCLLEPRRDMKHEEVFFYDHVVKTLCWGWWGQDQGLSTSSGLLK